MWMCSSALGMACSRASSRSQRQGWADGMAGRAGAWGGSHGGSAHAVGDAQRAQVAPVGGGAAVSGAVQFLPGALSLIGRRFGRCDSSTGWSCVKMVCWNACKLASGESKSFIARRNQTRLVSGVTGQTNSAIDSRKSGQRHGGGVGHLGQHRV
jgi:hypothetical protein